MSGLPSQLVYLGKVQSLFLADQRPMIKFGGMLLTSNVSGNEIYLVPNKPHPTAKVDKSDLALARKSKAVSLWSRWTGFERGEVRGKVLKVPDTDVSFKSIGKATEIFYRSDKWNKGVPKDYVHSFKRLPSIYQFGKSDVFRIGPVRITARGIEDAARYENGNPGNPLRKTGWKIQSLVFDSKDYTEASARDWARRHGFRHGFVHLADGTIRARQDVPGRFSRFRYFDIKPGVRAIYGQLKKGSAKMNPKGKRDKAPSIGGSIMKAELTPERLKIYERRFGKKAREMLESSGELKEISPSRFEEAARSWRSSTLGRWVVSSPDQKWHKRFHERKDALEFLHQKVDEIGEKISEQGAEVEIYGDDDSGYWIGEKGADRRHGIDINIYEDNPKGDWFELVPVNVVATHYQYDFSGVGGLEFYLRDPVWDEDARARFSSYAPGLERSTEILSKAGYSEEEIRGIYDNARAFNTKKHKFDKPVKAIMKVHRFKCEYPGKYER